MTLARGSCRGTDVKCEMLSDFIKEKRISNKRKFRRPSYVVVVFVNQHLINCVAKPVTHSGGEYGQLRRVANPVPINARYRPVIWLLYVVVGDLVQVALYAYVERNLSVAVYVVCAVV